MEKLNAHEISRYQNSTMPITRSQAALRPKSYQAVPTPSSKKKERSDGNHGADGDSSEDPRRKRRKKEVAEKDEEQGGDSSAQAHSWQPQTGTIERGHIYFFYRPKVEQEEAHSIDEVARFHMLLVPRPPEFATYAEDVNRQSEPDEDMKVLERGSDAIPAHTTRNFTEKHYRLVSIGKKRLPDPSGPASGRKETFWGTVTAVGDDLASLEKGLGRKEYETKTRGTRHEAPSRLAGRGAYAIVNNEPRAPSQRSTHLGYYLSHPAEPGEPQEALGLRSSSSFVVQVKNPLAPVSGGQRVGLSPNKRAKYPDWLINNAFGKGRGKGREGYGLRFAPVESTELLEYEGAELLLIAARSGEEGLEISLGEGRGYALRDAEEKESENSINEVLEELATDSAHFPAEPLKGDWI